MTDHIQQDLKIGYMGGCGGHFLFHIILLSGKYHAVSCDGKNENDMEQILQKQWSIQDHNQWKTYEQRPDLKATLRSPSTKPKIFLKCNPNAQDEMPTYCPTVTKADRPMAGRFDLGWHELPGKSLILYTDIESQNELAWYKKVAWYRLGNKEKLIKSPDWLDKQNKQKWKDHYENFRDPSWPDCDDPESVYGLPFHIQKEIFDSAFTHSALEQTEYYWRYQNHAVFPAYRDFLQTADYVVYLQDLVNSRLQILVDLKIIDAVSSKQIELLTKWCSLHPDSLLDSIGIKFPNK